MYLLCETSHPSATCNFKSSRAFPAKQSASCCMVCSISAPLITAFLSIVSDRGLVRMREDERTQNSNANAGFLEKKRIANILLMKGRGCVDYMVDAGVKLAAVDAGTQATMIEYQAWGRKPVYCNIIAVVTLHGYLVGTMTGALAGGIGFVPKCFRVGWISHAAVGASNPSSDALVLLPCSGASLIYPCYGRDGAGE